MSQRSGRSTDQTGTLYWPSDPAAWLTPAGSLAAWVAEREGRVVGHVCLVGGVDEPAIAAQLDPGDQRLACVSRLFVSPCARGDGLGASLLEEVTVAARRLSAVLLLDVVEDGGGAIALYERLGWRLVDRRLTDWTTPEGVMLPVRFYLQPDS